MRMPEILKLSRQDAEYELIRLYAIDIEIIAIKIKNVHKLKDNEIEELLDDKHYKTIIS